MVSYGPWIQDPDYEQTSSYNDDFRFDYLPTAQFGVGLIENWGTAHTPLSIPLLRTAHEESLTNFLAEGGHPSRTGVDIYWGWTNGTIGQRNWLSRVRASHDFRPWPVVPRPSFHSPTPPDDTAVIEWMDPTAGGQSEWVAAALDPTTKLGARNWDATEGGLGAELLESFATKICITAGNEVGGWPTDPPQDGATLASIVDATGHPSLIVYRDLNDEVDLTSYLNSDGRAWVYTVNDSFVSPRGDPGEVDPSNPQGRLTYGWVIDLLGIRWRYRPPVYRWVYDSTSSPSIRRTFPRHDSLAGGPGRNYPPSRAIQSSNRIGGGYL